VLLQESSAGFVTAQSPSSATVAAGRSVVVKGSDTPRVLGHTRVTNEHVQDDVEFAFEAMKRPHPNGVMASSVHRTTGRLPGLGGQQ
jgi:hypothetical protein